MERCTLLVSLLEHRWNGEILEEAKVVPIATAMRRRRLEWFGHVNNEYMKHKTSEQLQKWRCMGSALEEDRSWSGKILSGGTWKPGTSGRNGPLTEKDGNVSARPATPHRETAKKGDTSEKLWCREQPAAKDHFHVSIHRYYFYVHDKLLQIN